MKGVYQHCKEKNLHRYLAEFDHRYKRIDDLEKEVAGFENWETEKQRYQLTDFGGNSFAYSLKPQAANGEPSHRICPNCYERGQKAILQFKFRAATGRDKWINTTV